VIRPDGGRHRGPGVAAPRLRRRLRRLRLSYRAATRFGYAQERRLHPPQLGAAGAAHLPNAAAAAAAAAAARANERRPVVEALHEFGQHRIVARVTLDDVVEARNPLVVAAPQVNPF
jgi:hypothetical protein